MNYNSETLYRLMILYMLKSAAEPLTLLQISNFFVEKEYTSYLTIQAHVKALKMSFSLRSRKTTIKLLFPLPKKVWNLYSIFLQI